MSTVGGIVALIAMLVSGLGVFALYYALWHYFRGVPKWWSNLDARARRRVGISLILEVAFSAGFGAVLIISPWGHRTALYLLGGMALFLVIAIPIYTPILARHQIREAEQSRQGGGQNRASGAPPNDSGTARHR